MYSSLAAFFDEQPEATTSPPPGSSPIEWYTPGEATDDLKRRFAEAYTRMSCNAQLAAAAVEANIVKSTYIAAEWPKDPLVIEHARLYVEKLGAKAYLPTKDEMAAALFAEANGEKIGKALKLDYLKLACDLLGYIPKAGVNVQTNIDQSTVHHVMEVPIMETQEEMDKWIERQQDKLVADAA